MAAIGVGHEIDEHHSRAARNGDHQTRPDVGGACFIHSASFSPVTSRAIWQWPPQHWPPLPSSPHYVGECRLWLIGVSTAAASTPSEWWRTSHDGCGINTTSTTWVVSWKRWPAPPCNPPPSRSGSGRKSDDVNQRPRKGRRLHHHYAPARSQITRYAPYRSKAESEQIGTYRLGLDLRDGVGL